MEIKKGHPGAIFEWFFDSDQGTDHRTQILLMLYGSRPEMNTFMRNCIGRHTEFDDVLCLEILFLFFDPNVEARKLAEDGMLAEKGFRRDAPARFLFSGYGEARAIPPAIVELGRSKFRLEQPQSQHFEQIAAAAATAHARSIQFFQTAFNIEPHSNNLILAHRTQNR